MKKPNRCLEQARVLGKELHIDLQYPRSMDVDKLVIGLEDVRASDSIRIGYDFDRDGWKIEQASTFQWEADDEVCDPDWQEVCFVQSWGRENEIE